MPAQHAPPVLSGQELRQVVGRLIRRLRAEPGLPAPQLTVLGRLDRGGPASVSDLAAAEHMRPQSMAQTVRELERAGFVSRRPDPDDGRRSFVELTAAGTTTLRETRERREDWLTSAIEAELDPTEQKLLSQALELLARIADS
jgi:DNA-binding MarR family transcriptional regulator